MSWTTTQLFILHQPHNLSAVCIVLLYSIAILEQSVFTRSFLGDTSPWIQSHISPHARYQIWLYYHWLFNRLWSWCWKGSATLVSFLEPSCFSANFLPREGGLYRGRKPFQAGRVNDLKLATPWNQLVTTGIQMNGSNSKWPNVIFSCQPQIDQFYI